MQMRKLRGAFQNLLFVREQVRKPHRPVAPDVLHGLVDRGHQHVGGGRGLEDIQIISQLFPVYEASPHMEQRRLREPRKCLVHAVVDEIRSQRKRTHRQLRIQGKMRPVRLIDDQGNPFAVRDVRNRLHILYHAFIAGGGKKDRPCLRMLRKGLLDLCGIHGAGEVISIAVRVHCLFRADLTDRKPHQLRGMGEGTVCAGNGDDRTVFSGGSTNGGQHTRTGTADQKKGFHIFAQGTVHPCTV